LPPAGRLSYILSPVPCLLLTFTLFSVIIIAYFERNKKVFLYQLQELIT
jgi:hypothetical protein